MPDTRSSSQQWQNEIEVHRDRAERQSAYADLLESLDPKLRNDIVVINGVWQLHVLPVGASTNGRSLFVTRTATGYSMRVTEGLVHVIASARPNLLKAPEALSRMIRGLIGTPDPAVSQRPPGEWAEKVEAARRVAREAEDRAQLLESVDEHFRERAQVYANTKDLGILRRGDEAHDGVGIWIDRLPEGWQMKLVTSRRGLSPQLHRQATVSLDDGPSTLADLLQELVGSAVESTQTARDAFQRMCREVVAPFLRSQGFKGTSRSFERVVDGHTIRLGFQCNRHSTRERVDFCVHAYVGRGVTAKITTTDWHDSYPGIRSDYNSYWMGIRAQDDFEAVGQDVVEGIRGWLLPKINEVL